MASKTIPKILIVGGGAGGLELVTRLGNTLGKKNLAKIALADGSPIHIWKPLFHEVATGALNDGEDAVNYFAHASRNNYRFFYGCMTGLDREKKVIQVGAAQDLEGNVVCGPREIEYDKLVLAIGGLTNSFGTPGVNEHCMKLNSINDAELLRKRLLGYALAMEFKKIDKFKIGIVGGGATGVELAAAIHHALTEIKSYGSRVRPEDIDMSILEAAPTLLAAAPESAHMAEGALSELTRKGIQVRTGCLIQGVTDKGFRVEGGDLIEKDLRIWTAGIKAPNWLSELGLETDRINRIVVNEYLQSKEDPDIYAIGDCAHCKDYKDNTKVLPASAQCAHQQAEWLAKRLRSVIRNKRSPSPFVYTSQGMIVAVGGSYAVGTMQNILSKLDLKIKGKGAKALYSSLYRMHQAAIYGNYRAFGIYLGDKLRGHTLPPVKLH